MLEIVTVSYVQKKCFQKIQIYLLLHFLKLLLHIEYECISNARDTLTRCIHTVFYSYYIIKCNRNKELKCDLVKKKAFNDQTIVGGRTCKPQTITLQLYHNNDKKG